MRTSSFPEGRIFKYGICVAKTKPCGQRRKKRSFEYAFLLQGVSLDRMVDRLRHTVIHAHASIAESIFIRARSRQFGTAASVVFIRGSYFLRAESLYRRPHLLSVGKQVRIIDLHVIIKWSLRGKYRLCPHLPKSVPGHGTHV